MKESQIEAKLGKMVRAKGGLYYKFVSPGNPGVPDRIVITADGRCIFVELKTWQREELRRRGADVRVLKGMADVEEFAREVLAYAVCPA